MKINGTEKQRHQFLFWVATSWEEIRFKIPVYVTWAIKAHESSGLGLDREQGRWTAHSALCTPQPSGYKEFRDTRVSDPLCSFCLTAGDMHVFLPTKTCTDDLQEPKAHKNNFFFFHRNHFSSKFSCNLTAFCVNALFIYHFSLSSEKIIIIIVIIMT